jgi:hypothetical protein
MRYFWLFWVLFVAETGSSLWLMLRSPFDGPIDSYLGRLLYWLFIAVFCLAVWVFLARQSASADDRRDKSHKPNRFGQLGSLGVTIVIGLAIEVLTSISYWKSSYSRGVRDLYQSIWYWHHVPQPSDFGWPSFRGYAWAHSTHWAFFFSVGLIICYLINKKRATQ